MALFSTPAFNQRAMTKATHRDAFSHPFSTGDRRPRGLPALLRKVNTRARLRRFCHGFGQMRML
jgi:hypothetical protein